MGFALAEAFVDIGIRDQAYKSGMANIKSSVAGLSAPFAQLQSLARKTFFGITAAFALFIKAASGAEDAEIKLRAALQDDTAATSLLKFGQSLQLITVYSKDAIAEGLAFASALGVTTDQMQAVTEVGMGLATKFFGGDLKAGMEAAAKATQGNTRELDRLIPGMKQTTSAAEKLKLVQQAGMDGFRQSEARTKTFSGGLKQLYNQVGEVAEGLGKVLIPVVGSAVKMFEAVALKLQNLTPEQNKQVVKWLAIAAGIAAFIAFGPQIVAFGSIVIKVFGAIGQAILGVGKLFVFLVTSPIGLVIVGIAAIATAFAYLIGAGDSATGRIIDGFMKIINFLDHLLGSWEGFTSGIGMLWDQVIDYIAEGFTKLKEWLLNAWEYLGEGVEAIWWSSFEGMYNAWNYLKAGAMQFINWLSHAWDQMTDVLADALTGLFLIGQHDSNNAFKEALQKQVASGKITQAKADEQYNNSVAQDGKYDTSGRKKERSAKQKAYEDSQKAVDNDYESKKSEMAKQVDAERLASKNKREGNRAANRSDSQAAIKQLEADRKQSQKNNAEEFSKLPKLSDKAKGLFNKLKESSGLGGIMDIVGKITGGAKDLEAEAAKAKADAEKAAANPGDLHLGNGVGEKKQKPVEIKAQDITSTFKNMAAMRLLTGNAEVDLKVKLAQQQLAEQKKHTAAAAAAAAALVALPAGIAAALQVGYAA